jgi:hypothetical protein
VSTLGALRAAGLRVVLLPVRRDVDWWEDAVAVAAQAPRTRFAARVRQFGHGVGRCAVS